MQVRDCWVRDAVSRCGCKVTDCSRWCGLLYLAMCEAAGYLLLDVGTLQSALSGDKYGRDKKRWIHDYLSAGTAYPRSPWIVALLPKTIALLSAFPSSSSQVYFLFATLSLKKCGLLNSFLSNCTTRWLKICPCCLLFCTLITALHTFDGKSFDYVYILLNKTIFQNNTYKV